MLPHDVQQDPPSPARLLEMLVDRFGIFEAAASASITLARLDPEGEVELPMEPAVAEAVMEFGSDLRSAWHAVRQVAYVTLPFNPPCSSKSRIDVQEQDL